MKSDEISATDRSTLVRIARESIAHGLAHSRSLPVEPRKFNGPLQRVRASFVTLLQHGILRGCIGHLEATHALVADVAENAYSAAFTDPRFPPVSRSELDTLDMHISVLGPPEALPFESEADLIRQLRPGKDGLILTEGRLRGTFLPTVWESLPEPSDFLRELKLKAGLSGAYWSDTLTVHRYTTESFS